MTLTGFLALLPALLGMIGAEAAVEQPQVRTMMVADEMIIRVPVRPRALPPFLAWSERKGPKCIDAGAIRGAMLSGPTHVDFLLLDRSRVRARFSDSCPALDFYGGFYLKPEDERLCARRDSIHSRMGGSCRIERFRKLEPKPRG